AVLNSAKFISKMGYNVNLIKPNSEGIIYPDELEKLISDKTKLVSVMLANNEIGTIEPIKELAKIAHEKGALFHTDAVQAIGHIKIDVKDLCIDLLSASAHKFNGPKGIGFLYVKETTGIEQYIHGGAQENGMRAGTENIPAIVGMAYSLQKNCNSIEENFEYVKKLENSLLDKLSYASNIEYIKNGSKNTLPGNISLSFKNKSGEAILHRLDLKSICVSTSSACDSKNTKISHVLKSIGLPENYAIGTIRISLGKYNTQEEIDSIVRELINICK
ncbi:MAG: cysteine desulfurase, partial [Clostridia bacterium]|nr:cysteine desulfurase [Clostridia bacterium]